MKVILDNGHGVDTPGKRSPIWEDGTQLFEYEFNREVALGLLSELSMLGIEATLLVPEIADVPLQERVRRANKIYKDEGGEAILISIHANAGGGTGWEVFTSKGQTTSDVIAAYLYSAAKAVLPKWTRLRTDYTDGDPDKEANFYLLRKTKCPAVLTENYFMDTKKDCDYIASEGGRRGVIRMHLMGILEYINSISKTIS